MIIGYVENHWVCDLCGHKGPKFEGTAEDARPKEWLIGDMKIIGVTASTGDLTVAYCPDCVPKWREFNAARAKSLSRSTVPDPLLARTAETASAKVNG